MLLFDGLHPSHMNYLLFHSEIVAEAKSCEVYKKVGFL